MKTIATGLFLFLALPLAADEVVLRNGGRIQGRVSETAQEITIVMDIGAVTFKRSEVVRIIPGTSTLQEFDEKVRTLKGDDTEGRYKLALWARQHELGNRANQLLDDILLINPDHVQARSELGFQKYEGRWMKDTEVRAAQGFVNFRGAWIKQTEAEAVLQREADRVASVALQSELVKAQVSLLQAQADFTRAQAEAERVRASIEERRQQLMYELPYGVIVYRTVVANQKNHPCSCQNGR